MSQATSSLAAVVLAAGKGTRMKSERPKVLHEVCGRPLVAFAIERALEAGAERVVVVVGHRAELVEARVRQLFPTTPLEFALQAEQKGTGHALMCAEEKLPAGGDVLVLSGDVPLVTADTLRRLVQARRTANGALSLVTTRPPSPTGYGRIVRAQGAVGRIVEEKDASAEERLIGEVNAGIYCIERGFLASALPRLSPKNAQGEYYLTDLVREAAGDGRAIADVESSFTETSGINDRAELAQADAQLRSQINLALMRSGVTLRDPATTYVDVGVEVGQDCDIGPSVSLQGRTRLGKGVKVGQGCVLLDAVVADGTEIKPYSHFEGAQVGQRAVIGPFARLRPGTELSDEVHVGNFVETKKARLGKGSKANHLAYLGDAVIGQGCNIGAGTITCNYDGVHKHETRMGDGVFIGSDSQLVAPVTLGDGAYVGAGSTITKDVEAGALALTRAELTVKPGWASRRKAKLAAQKLEAQRLEGQAPAGGPSAKESKAGGA